MATVFFKGLFTYLQACLMHYVGNKAIMDLRNSIYRQILEMPLGFHNRTPSGNLMSNILNDVGYLQTALSFGIKGIFQQILTILGLSGVIIYQNWKLALIAFVVLPFSYLPLIKLGKRLRNISQTGQERIANLTTFLQETLVGIRLIKAFGTEEKEHSRFEGKNLQYFNNVMKNVQISEITSPLMEFIGGIGIVFIILYGGLSVVQGATTTGAFFSFLTACLLMYAPVRNLSQTHNVIQQALGSADRLFSILDAPTENKLNSGHLALYSVQKEILFKNVSFHYEGSQALVLKNINIHANHGDVVALVGESGSGKSTLVNLLPRFYEPLQGEITIDGINIQHYTLESLRSQISIVSQEIVLFDLSVRENISYGMKNVSDEAVVLAAKAAHAESFILKLPEDYETLIGERGVKLSGGERQRLAIARALLKDAPILILDEATSSLDSESESMIQQALQVLMKNRTTFVIAHRLSTIQNATSILVMDQGRIIESGTSGHLLGRNSMYKKLYETQFLR
ncbi:MAG TPA: ABC transporter ATP-binding protein [Nitrospiria bacterium]|nr:ABC transporter ATP-binding protein [Nitrospiria bacterium]